MERKPITAADIIERAEIVLAIAGFLTIIAGVGASSLTIVVIGLIMIYSAIVSLGYVLVLKGAFPVFSVSVVCGGLLFILSIETLIRSQVTWPMVLALIASLIALFAAYVAYAKPKFGRPSL